MGNVTDRKYPRIAVRHHGFLAARMKTTSAFSAGEKVLIPISIRSLSCEGAGICLAQTTTWYPQKASTVTLQFHAGATRFEIPGKVVWMKPPLVQAKIDFGIRFQLEFTTNAIRQQYAHWIVGQLAQAETPAHVHQ